MWNPIRNYLGRLIDLKLAEKMNDFFDPLSFDERFRLLEHEVQFKGETAELLNFYKNKRPTFEKYSSHLFWRDVEGNIPVQHFPLPRIITKAKTDLVWHDSPVIQVVNSRGNDVPNATAMLKEILEDNQWLNKFRNASDMMSYSGAVAFVPVIDKSFTDYPIIRCYPRERFHPNFKYDRVVSVICYDEYTVGKEKYTLATEYGMGYISYLLLDKNQREVAISNVPELAGLKDIVVFDNDNYISKVPMFIYVPNGADGLSDYQNLIDDFALIDESYSALSDLIRKGHIKTYIPKSMAIKMSDSKGDINTYMPGDFSENVVFIPQANPTNAPYKIERDTIALNENAQSLMSAFNETLNHALLTTGLSPATIGLDLAGANASGEALNIRERVSMRTRATLIDVWTNALKQVCVLLLRLHQAVENINGEYYEIYLPDLQNDITVEFAEYEAPTFDQKVQSLDQAMQAGLIDRESALRQLYPDKSDEEIEKMLILIEGGLPTDVDDIIDKEEKEVEETEEEKVDEEE